MISNARPVGGMNQDIYPKSQPDGTYRFALNAILETKNGDVTTISNELGNVTCANGFPTTKQIIGHVLLDTNEVVLFLFHDDVRPEHEIGIFNPDACLYTTIAKGACLNFSLEHQINAIFRIKNGCDKYVYFTDNYNDYRVINITDVTEWVAVNKFIPDCSVIEYSRDVRIPYFFNQYTKVEDGGGRMEYGSYTFYLRLLDKAQNPTDWLFSSEPVLIPTNNATIGFRENSVGASNVSDDPTYMAPTNKSIKFRIGNIDKRFYYYQVAAVRRTDISGSITSIDVLAPIEILDHTSGVTISDFIYRGLDHPTTAQISLEELLASRQPLHLVTAHAIKNDRLVVGNIKERKWDYSTFQRFASKIRTDYIAKSVEEEFDAKYPEYNNGLDGTLPHDEVLALGIVYVMRDGTTSPVFHIPGRPADDNIEGTNPFITVFTNWDTDVINPADPNIVLTTHNKRWQVYNTATKWGQTGPTITGMMGYYECPTKYPTYVKVCDNDPLGYWGEDWQGNPLTNTPIRHHRTPDFIIRYTDDLEEYEDDIRHYKVGLRFTNVKYPNDDVVGHFFVIGDRTTERTVIDQGRLVPLRYADAAGDGIYYYDPAGPANTVTFNDVPRHVWAYISNSVLFDTTLTGALYFKWNKLVALDAPLVPPVDPANITVPGYNTTLDFELAINRYWEYIPKNNNYPINLASLLQKAVLGQPLGNGINVSVGADSGYIVNNSLHSNIGILQIDRPLDDDIVLYPDIFTNLYSVHGSLKTYTDVFSDLTQITYKKLEGSIRTFTTNPQVMYPSECYLTDTFYVDYGWAQNTLDVNITGSIDCFYSESEIQSELRSSGADSRTAFFKHDPLNIDNLPPLSQYIASKYHEEEIDIALFHPEQYLYNKSYSFYNADQAFFPLPYNFEYCGSCDESLPYRMYFSQADSQESKKDMFRIIYPNNYKDINGKSGSITDLFVNFDKLYVLTSSSLHYQPTSEQQLQTNENSIFLGTGAFFSLDPIELKTTDYAFGGSTLWKSRIVTEYGAAYVDDRTNRPILFSSELTDLSLKGMRNYWKEYGELVLNKQFVEFTGTEYPIKSTSSPVGIGYITTYDPASKRLIFCKKDYAIRDGILLVTYPDPLDTGVDQLYFDGTSFTGVSHGAVSPVTLSDPNFFDNKSFTLSYSFVTNSWDSFHSYLPNYVFNDKSTFFSSVDKIPWKHNNGNYQTFYAQKYDHIVDLILKGDPLMMLSNNNVIYTSQSMLNDGDVPTTFDRMIAYNTRQSTGLQNLELKDTPFEQDPSQGHTLVSKTDRQYRINSLRDYVVDSALPIWSEDYSLTQASYFIDKVPNDPNISFSISPFDEKRFKDTYLGLRLFFNPQENIEINTDTVVSVTSSKNR